MDLKLGDLDPVLIVNDWLSICSVMRPMVHRLSVLRDIVRHCIFQNYFFPVHSYSRKDERRRGYGTEL
jgi:hypothetical protein